MAKKRIYSVWFLVPAMAILIAFFVIPTILSFYFSLTVWNFDNVTFCGLDNFKQFLTEGSLRIGIVNTMIYAVLTSGLKVIIAFLIAVFLTTAIKTKTLQRSIVFFPNLVSTMAVGTTFKAMMHPSKGIINQFLALLGIAAVDWLGNTKLALYSVIGVDVWKGLSISVVVFIAGIQSIDRTYFEAAMVDGAGPVARLLHVTIPLARSSINTIILVSFISGLRYFDLIWAMTKGGPGFATDVITSVIYKQYAAGYYGLSTAGNVIMFILVAAIAFPLQRFLVSQEST